MPLGKICFLTKPHETENGILPYLEVKYLRKQASAKLLKSGLFISKNSHTILVDGENSGEVFDINEDGYMGSTFMQLIIPKCVNSAYIKYFIDYNRAILKNNKKGSAIPHLNKEIFKNLQILLPSIKTQEQIVFTLDDTMQKLQTIKAEL